jgi:hypothetical protein
MTYSSFGAELSLRDSLKGGVDRGGRNRRLVPPVSREMRDDWPDLFDAQATAVLR